MSVKSLIAVQEVRERLDRVLPPFARLSNVPLKVPPRTKRYGLVGTAFDYALRFELKRRNPHAIERRWVADAAIERIAAAAELAGHTKKQARQFEKQGAAILEGARAFDTAFKSCSDPSFPQLAVHALLLAKLDNVFRALSLDATLSEADPADCQDIVELLAVAPYPRLSHPETLLLNPTFGMYSSVVGGADADLVCGDLLVEIKTTKNPAIRPESVRQLVVYAMLAQRARTEEGDFPPVRRLGIYLSRHALLWEVPVAAITAHPLYSDTEEWLIGFAAKTEMDPDLRELWNTMYEDAEEPRKSKRTRPSGRPTSRSVRRRRSGD